MTESISARITLPAEAAASALRRHLAFYEIECEEIAGGLRATVWGGTLRLLWGDGGVRVIAEAPDMTMLFALQEGVAHALDHEGGTAVWEQVTEGALAPNLSLVQVESVTQISPGYRRIRVVGDVARFEANGLHFRVLIPPDGVAPEWPRLDANGRARWPEGAAELHRPAFTTRAMGDGWLDFDVFLHEGARTTEWSKTAQGKTVGLIGPGGGWLMDEPWVALFGDETALPAIARMLEGLPREAQGCAYLKVAECDMQDMAHPPGVRLARTDDLLSALLRTEAPEGPRRFWFAAEKSEATRARELMKAKGLAKTEMVAAGYWSRD